MVLVLSDARTAMEHRLVDAWAETHHPGATVLSLDRDPTAATALQASLAEGEEGVEAVPVRVTWLPLERGAGQRLKSRQLLLLGRPRRPLGPLQAFLDRAALGSASVTPGGSATLGELRDRYRHRHRDGDDPVGEAFTHFVRRQALLACDREERRLLGDRYKVPRLVAEQLWDDPAFVAGVEDLAATSRRTLDDVRADVDVALDEMVTVQSPLIVDLWQSMVRPLYRRAWDLDVDESGLAGLREANRRSPLIFLPSHRSYVDPVLMSEVLLANDLPRNHTLGGINGAFWPLDRIARRVGVIFIRRSFGDDEAYKFVMRWYLAHLLRKRFNLEWYIEGGRMRTGKLRRPRYGLLRYVVDAVRAHPDVDPILVPVSITYEQLPEVADMAAEEQGAAKQPESLSWLVGYIRRQRRHLGDAQVRFGEPLPLQQALADAGEGPTQVERVALRVCARINRVAPAMASSLVTYVLLGERDRAMTVAQVGDRLAPLLDHLEARGVERPSRDLRTTSGLVETLTALQREGVVECVDTGPTPVWSVHRDRHHTAAFYRNGFIHHLLVRAIAETCLAAGHDTVEDAALRLRDLLKFEFFFPARRDFLDLLRVEVAELRARPEQFRVAHHVLRSFLDAQRIVARVLATAEAPLTDETAVDRALGLGRQLHRQRLVHGEESLSRELFGGALLLFDNLGLRGPAATDRQWQSMVAELDELADVLDEVARAESLRLDVLATAGGS